MSINIKDKKRLVKKNKREYRRKNEKVNKKKEKKEIKVQLIQSYIAARQLCKLVAGHTDTAILTARYRVDLTMSTKV